MSPLVDASRSRRQALGLTDGDLVEVTSEVGSVQIALQCDGRHPPGLRLHDAGLRPSLEGPDDCLWRGRFSDSELHVTYTDPVSGGQALSQTFVTVKKA